MAKFIDCLDSATTYVGLASMLSVTMGLVWLLFKALIVAAGASALVGGIAAASILAIPFVGLGCYSLYRHAISSEKTRPSPEEGESLSASVENSPSSSHPFGNSNNVVNRQLSQFPQDYGSVSHQGGYVSFERFQPQSSETCFTPVLRWIRSCWSGDNKGDNAMSPAVARTDMKRRRSTGSYF